MYSVRSPKAWYPSLHSAPRRSIDPRQTKTGSNNKGVGKRVASEAAATRTKMHGRSFWTAEGLCTLLNDTVSLPQRAVDLIDDAAAVADRRGIERAGAAVISARCRHKAAAAQIEHVHFSVLDDVVPAVQ